MFIDKIAIKIASGKGGDGCVSFYRAKYVTNGGPDGGDGGRGGAVVFVADKNKTTLLDFRYKRDYRAADGEAGAKRNCSGRASDDIEIFVPVGTVIRDARNNRVLRDMAINGERFTAIGGGRGGRGNQHFATSVRQAPRYAEHGGASRGADILLELKLIADAGLVGFPNVGKSTLLKMVTNANPKIANYHFTTLSPNLGVVRVNNEDDFVLADIPGLIEGAAGGAGLGHEFLRHVERSRVLIHVVDCAAIERKDPLADIETINKELREYNPELLERPMVIACNKMDITTADENLRRIKSAYEPLGISVYPISAATNKGLDALINHINTLVKQSAPIVFAEEEIQPFEDASSTGRPPFTIHKESKDVYVVEGVGVEKMMGYTNIDTEKGFAFFQRYLKERGINEALDAAGIKKGDSVRIYDTWFDYVP